MTTKEEQYKYMVLLESGRNIYFYCPNLKSAQKKIEELVLDKDCLPDDIRLYEQLDMEMSVNIQIGEEK